MLRLSITNDFWTPFCAIRLSVEFSYKVKNKLSASLKENSFDERNQLIVQKPLTSHEGRSPTTWEFKHLCFTWEILAPKSTPSDFSYGIS